MCATKVWSFELESVAQKKAWSLELEMRRLLGVQRRFVEKKTLCFQTISNSNDGSFRFGRPAFEQFRPIS